MWKIISLWLAILAAPAIFLYAAADLYGLVVYLSYYAPLWIFGEPFFVFSTDIGWYYPTIYGHILAAFIYSLTFWGLYILMVKAKREMSSTNKRRQSD
ncbi:hypothetical protein [Gilvimarinus chinensis]|uniref:hypothetical protein n=1 Tax=Gilvimarinus chinensis TaxID=396005 RepID=UPI0003763DE7|nr:hypothetical protein [Gilvimarinus chinensis]